MLLNNLLNKSVGTYKIEYNSMYNLLIHNTHNHTHYSYVYYMFVCITNDFRC